MGKGYSKNGGEARGPKSSGAAGLVGDKLEEIARQGAQQMLAEALEMEVDEFLQRARYARGLEFRGYRNGHAPERAIGMGQVQMRVQYIRRMPRVSEVPVEVATRGFESKIVGRYQRAAETTQRLLAQLYLEGAEWVHSESTGDPSALLRAGL